MLPQNLCHNAVHEFATVGHNMIILTRNNFITSITVYYDVDRIHLSLDCSPRTQTERTLRKYYVCRLQPDNRKDIDADTQLRKTVGVGLLLGFQSGPLGALARLFALGIGGPPPGEEHKWQLREKWCLAVLPGPIEHHGV